MTMTTTTMIMMVVIVMMGLTIPTNDMIRVGQSWWCEKKITSIQLIKTMIMINILDGPISFSFMTY